MDIFFFGVCIINIFLSADFSRGKDKGADLLSRAFEGSLLLDAEIGWPGYQRTRAGEGEMPAGATGWGETSQDLGIHFNAISLGGLLVRLFFLSY